MMRGSRQTLKWPSWVMVAIAIGVVTAVVLATRVSAATSTAVDIKDFKFSPASLTVPVGTTGTWTNHDEETHTITSTTGAFSSAGLSDGDTFARTFTQPGTYQYFCSLHPHMRAAVIVK
jgi:plastocyanin